MSLSPLSSKSIVFLLGLLYLQAYTVDATISTSAGFPQDVFAKPAFQVNYGNTHKTSPALPIKRADALNILEQQEASSSSTSNRPPSPSDLAHTSSSSLAVPGQPERQAGTTSHVASRTLFWSLQRSSPTDFQLCSIPDFTFTPADKLASRPSTDSARSRHDLIRNAQKLLDPLKKVCLYHTSDWFTYSFCHGREIRQFRRLTAQDAVNKGLKAFKAAGGGDAGHKAALEAAEKVAAQPYPTANPEFPAFILGRWTPQTEEIVGDDRSHQRRQQQPLTDNTEPSTGVAVSANLDMPSLVNSAGLDLVEEVQFGDWDEEELFAAEAKALAHFQDSSTTSNEQNRGIAATIAATAGHESQRHRYLTQRWTNGTMCDMNHQPRTVEVQYRCSNRKPHEDRIVMIKETTICNYVLVIETPRLCADAAFGSEKEEASLPIQCHRVVDDGYAGPTVGDPGKVMQPALSEIEGGVQADGGEKALEQSQADSSKASKDSKDDDKATSSQDGAEDATSTSHTYGDLSRYGSVHDDYYDEALGGPGALYQQYHRDHEHEHDHDHEHGGAEIDEADVVIEIGVDEHGRPFVNRVTNPQSGGSPASNSEKTRRKESGKKRNDDDANTEEQKSLEIQLDTDDVLSVLRGDEGGSLEKKVAEKISKLLNKQMERDASQATGTGAKSDKKKEKKEPEQENLMELDVDELWRRLVANVDRELGLGVNKQQTGVKGGHFGKKGQQGKPGAPALRMEKVGDSLSERAKRFYDAKKREEGKGGEQPKKEKVEAPPIAQHLEL
ncbi:uncharacterized protein UTRI_05347_B [Ustilago trichophora]|uniref:Protein OS-9 homolog n=1 Tax=Ustilago trichophora TaxID=86804 RepID=A0A5C3ELN0_9BASI|nr:uncharacterized protein UTRI_05347_B [Ustilago trichophora]